MKKTLLIAAAASLSLTGTFAMADPGHGRGHAYGHAKHGKHHDARAWRDSDRDGVSDRAEWNRDRDRDGRPDQYDRFDDRRDRGHSPSYGYGYGYEPDHDDDDYEDERDWRVGQRYPYYNQPGYVLDDWRSYGLPAPRSGYQYYRSGGGDVVMATIAGGLIARVLENLLAR